MSRNLNKSIKTLFTVGLFSGTCMYLLNRSISKQACKKNILKKGAGYNYPWKYGDIYYRKTGYGKKNILLIHDVNAYSSGYEFNDVAAFLGSEYTVYTLDLIGCGRSDKPAMTYTNYLYVLLITDFIREVIKEQTEVAAVGLSSSFAVMAAHQSPDLISKLTMINPLSLKKLAQIPDSKSKSLAAIMAIPVVGTFIYYLMNSRSNLEYLLDEKYFYNPFKVRAKLLDACYESSHRDDGNGRFLLASIDGKYVNWNINRAIASSSTPMHIIFGLKMPRAGKIVHEYTKLNSAIESSFVPASKMFPQIEEAEALSKLIIDAK